MKSFQKSKSIYYDIDRKSMLDWTGKNFNELAPAQNRVFLRVRFVVRLSSSFITFGSFFP